MATAAACVQFPLLAIIFFGDFGFVFPGRMGDVGDWIIWILVYVIVLIFALRHRTWMGAID